MENRVRERGKGKRERKDPDSSEAQVHSPKVHLPAKEGCHYN